MFKDEIGPLRGIHCWLSSLFGFEKVYLMFFKLRSCFVEMFFNGRKQDVNLTKWICFAWDQALLEIQPTDGYQRFTVPNHF